MNRELEALDKLYISTAPTPDEVWKSSSSYHVESLHPEVSRRLISSMNAIRVDHAPITAVVRGDHGSGKTHLLGWTREQIQSRGGFFFYMKLVTGQGFWESATDSLVDSLYRKDEGGQAQLRYLLDALSRRAGLDERSRAAVTGHRDVTPADVDAFVRGIRGLDLQVGNEAASTARALVLIASSGDVAEIGSSYLALNDDEFGQRVAWRLPSRAQPAQRVLRDLTRLFALVGPIVFAFDQLDNLIAASTASLGSSSDSRVVRRLSSDIAAGLMALREEARRTFMVIACLPNTWEQIKQAAMQSALDRFEELPTLGEIPDEATAAAIVGGRFRSGYESAHFMPPSRTWPISAAAIAEAPHRYTVRRLLDRVAAHIKSCQDTGVVSELTSFADKPAATPAPATTGPAGDLNELTATFDRLRDEADDRGPLDAAMENSLLPGMLGAGLLSLVKELGGDDTRFVVETHFGGKWALHARLRYIVDEASETEIHWSFRGIAHNNPIAAQTRMRNAMGESGLAAELPSRRLFLLRNTSYPSGQKMGQLKDDFLARGGSALPIGAADLRTFTALRTMLREHSPELDAWLKRIRPAARTEVFASVLRDLEPHVDMSAAQDETVNSTALESAADADPTQPEITIGAGKRGGRPFTVPLKELRKHTVVVGAAGSGKTVLIKRIIEQCAMRGVSAIVLDPNEDLGRLGDHWPSTPDGWTDDQEGEAQRYFSGTEVIVWTPGLNRGRPLTFHPIPDFGPVFDDVDDFQRLLMSTTAAIAPQAGVQGHGARSTQQRGVLQRILERYVREGGRNLVGLVQLLAEPPGDIVNTRTSRLAVAMADTLEAAMTTDPLFGESGAPADPAELLTPSPGKSARISVISFVGLPGEGSTTFVRRLQASLFSWFKAHPASGRPLGGLLVMDEAQNFVPSGRANPSTDSTIEIIRQIRKYGLGMVLASQAPKGIHHHALGNTANQFIGRLTAQAQIDVARAMAQSRNSSASDFGILTRGEFHAAKEGTGFSKIEVPICLSHHAGPLVEDEVVERARRA